LDCLAADTLVLTAARQVGQLAAVDDPILENLIKRLQDARDQSADGLFNLTDNFEGDWKKLAHYTILGVLGRGGMGIALKARDEKLNRLVCLKVFAGGTEASGRASERWMREARAAAAVESPHVIKIYAVDEHEGRPYLAMEYVEGRSLQEELDDRGRLPIDEVLAIARQITLGLAAAHERGLVHRDIKPGNILLETSTNRVKIADFGMARAADDSRLTAEGCIAGTPEYMSPEQVNGGIVDRRSDLFSLGSVLHTMCTAESPFEADSSMAVLRRVLDDMPVTVKKSRPEIPAAISKLIRRLHQKKPERRPQSAEEVLQELDRVDVAASDLPSRRAAILAGVMGIGGLTGAFFVSGGQTPQRQALENASVDGRSVVPGARKRAPRVLFVLPPSGFYGLYYVGVRRHLDQQGVKCQVASINMHTCKSAAISPETTVLPDLMINYARGGDYDLVYFCGGEIYEAGGTHELQARRIIDEALAASRFVAAIGRAPLILADAGVLRARRATVSRFGKPPGVYIEQLKAAGVEWQQDAIVEDRPFLTGRDPEDVLKFTATMLRILGVSPPEFHNLPPPQN
jgi:putative intracellular protease/amidase